VRLRRKRPAPSVEPDRFDAAAEVLERWATRGSGQSMTYRRRREARQRQKAKQDSVTAPPAPDARSPVFLETPAAARLQPRAEIVPTPPAPFVQPVPSDPPAPVPAPKTSDEWGYEHFLAFETLCGNTDRIAERLEEARAYEPEEAPPEYVW
jgi:hypothetical protein